MSVNVIITVYMLEFNLEAYLSDLGPVRLRHDVSTA